MVPESRPLWSDVFAAPSSKPPRSLSEGGSRPSCPCPCPRGKSRDRPADPGLALPAADRQARRLIREQRATRRAANSKGCVRDQTLRIIHPLRPHRCHSLHPRPAPRPDAITSPLPSGIHTSICASSSPAIEPIRRRCWTQKWLGIRARTSTGTWYVHFFASKSPTMSPQGSWN